MATVCRWPPGQGRDRRTHVEAADGQGTQQLAGAAFHLHVVEDAGAVDLTAEEEVGDDVEVAAQREVLVTVAMPRAGHRAGV